MPTGVRDAAAEDVKRAGRTRDTASAGFAKASRRRVTSTGVSAALNTVPDSQNSDVNSAAAAELMLATTSVRTEMPSRWPIEPG